MAAWTQVCNNSRPQMQRLPCTTTLPTEEIKYVAQSPTIDFFKHTLLNLFQTGPPANYTDINQILDQILNITDQSLDEAQVTSS